MAEGEKTLIKNLCNPYKILSLNFSNLKLHQDTIFKVHKKPAPSKLLNIKTRTRSIKVTHEHRFFVLEGEEIKEKMAFELKVQDLIASVRRIPSPKKGYEFSIGNRVGSELYYIIDENGRSILKKKRLEKHLRHKDIDRSLNSCMYYQIERGISMCKMEYLKKICRILDIDYIYFVNNYAVQRLRHSNRDVTFPIHSSQEVYQLLGYLLGDASVYNKTDNERILEASDKDIQIMNLYARIIKKLFGVDINIRYISNKNSYKAKISSYVLRFYEDICGEEVFCNSSIRFVPQFIYRIPKNELSSFLRGFFDAEGTVGDHNISCTSSSKRLIKDIQFLLLRF
ncbi:MAG: LAGLIDADG family homing endonuclease, partial [Methanosarcinales archaeon]